jgi:hypothetical protein
MLFASVFKHTTFHTFVKRVCRAPSANGLVAVGSLFRRSQLRIGRRIQGVLHTVPMIPITFARSLPILGKSTQPFFSTGTQAAACDGLARVQGHVGPCNCRFFGRWARVSVSGVVICAGRVWG